MIAQDIIDKIKSSADIVKVVQEYIDVKKAGVNHKGCCPFHNEKTSSFVVSPAKGIYKCFGCGASGGVIDFVQRMESISFPEAATLLGKKYGIEIPRTEATPEQAQRMTERDMIAEINEVAMEYFRQSYSTADNAKTYLAGRNIIASDIDTFELGYAGGNFRAFAKAKGYTDEQMLSAGLVNYDGSKYYDFFRSRLMFPIRGLSNKLLGFSGRILTEAKNTAKYVNSRETDLFHKGEILYAFNRAKQHIAKQSRAVIVEGYTDVISWHRAGVQEATATCGTALTPAHAKLIKRFAREALTVFDSDTAGDKATTRSLMPLISEGLAVNVLILPDGHDPDSFARSMDKKDGLSQFIEKNKKTWIQYYFDKFGGKTSADRADALQEIVGIIAHEPCEITRGQYLREAGQLFDADTAVLAKNMKPVAVASGTVPEQEILDAVKSTGELTVYDTHDDYVKHASASKYLNCICIDNVTEKLVELLCANKDTQVYLGSYPDKIFDDKGKEVAIIAFAKRLSIHKLSVLVEDKSVYENARKSEDSDTIWASFSQIYLGLLEANTNILIDAEIKRALELSAEFCCTMDPTNQALAIRDTSKRYSISATAFGKIMKPYEAAKKNIITQMHEQIVIDEESYVFSATNLPDYVDQAFYNKYKFFPVQNKAGRKIFYMFSSEHGSLQKIANFYVEALFHIKHDDDLKNKRVMRFNHAELNTVEYIEIESSKMVELPTFKKAVFNIGPYSLQGAKTFHWDLIRDSMKFPTVEQIEVWGQQKKNRDFFAFPNAILADGEIQYMDELGLVQWDGKTYYSPSASLMHRGNEEYANNRFLNYREAKHTDFAKWTKLMLDVYKYNDNGYWSILYTIMCAFRSDIFPIHRYFTAVFFIGPTECGKSQLAQSIRAIFVHPDAPMFNLNSGTDAAFFTVLEANRDIPVIAEEYNDTDITPAKFQGLKAAVYDGEGKTKRKAAGSKDLDISEVNAPLIMLGQEAPERDDASLLNRIIALYVKKNESWTELEKDTFNDLKSRELKGMSNILIDILKQRPMVRKNFRDELRIVQKEMQKSLNDSKLPFQTRVLNTTSLFLCICKLWETHVPELKLNFTYAQFFEIAKRKIVASSETISKNNRLAVFFDTLILLANKEVGGLVYGREYIIKEDADNVTITKGNETKQVTFEGRKRSILYLRLNLIHPLYRDVSGKEHLKMNNLSSYLEDHPAYIGAVKSYRFEWREVYRASGNGRAEPIVQIKSQNTSCIALNYDLLKLDYDLGTISTSTSTIQDNLNKSGELFNNPFDTEEFEKLPS